MARLFISHSSRNNDKAIEVRDWLAKNGWDDVFLDLDPERGIVAGQRWKDALQKAAQRCELVLALISAEWLASPWCKAEIDAARLMGKKVIVALIGIDKAQVPPDLTDEQWIDLTGDPNAYARLREGLRRGGLDPSSFPFEEGRRPYPGFASLEEKDAAIFFGRDAQIVRGLDKIRSLVRAGVDRMLVILGASGSGKSSFFRAGLWPRLKRDDRTWLPLPTIRPERAVISGKYGLVQSLQQVMSDPQFADGIRQRDLPRSRADIQDFIDKTEDGLVKIFAALRDIAQVPGLSAETTPPPTVILSVDQGEELFNEDGRDEARRFIEILTGALKADPHALAILVMRSDSFPQLQAEARLADLPKDTFTLDMMLEGSTRAVIEGPARLVQPSPLKIDPQLTDALLQDVSGQDALPLLAFTLAHLYENYATDNELNLADYEKLGRLKGVIATTVREAFAEGVAKGELPKDARAQLALARMAFIPHLARVNPAGQFVRRIATRAEIPAEARPLIDRFAERRLLIRDRRKIAGEEVEVIEVAHEAMLREWRELHDALLEEREFLVAKGQLEGDVAEWQAASESHKSGALLSGNKLLRARDWLVTRPQELSVEERQYIKASSDQESRQRRRTRAGVIVAFVLISGFASYSIYEAWKATEQSRIAESERGRADGERRLALARQLSTQSEAALARGGQGLEASTLLALESLRSSWTPEGHELLLRQNTLLPGRPLRRFKAHERFGVRYTVVNAQRGWLVTSSDDEDAVWSLADGGLVRRVQANGSGSALSPAVSPDGRWLAAQCDQTWCVYDTETWSQVFRIPNDREVYMLDVGFSADNRVLGVAMSGASRMQLYETATWKEIAAIEHGGRMSSFAFSPQGNRVATAGESRLTVWTVPAGERVAETDGTGERVLAFSRDGRMLAGSQPIIASVGGLGETPPAIGVRLWDIAETPPRVELHSRGTLRAEQRSSATGSYDALAFSPDGKYLATPGAVFDTVSGREIATITPRGQTSVAFGNVARELFVGNDQGTIDVVSIDAKEEHRLTSKSAIHGVDFSPTGAHVAFGDQDGTVHIVQVDRWDEIARVEHEEPVSSVQWSPDGRWLSVIGDKIAVVHDTASWRVHKRLAQAKSIDGSNFSSDGRLFLTLTNSGVGVLRLQSADAPLVLEHDGRVEPRLQLSPDSRQLRTQTAAEYNRRVGLAKAAASYLWDIGKDVPVAVSDVGDESQSTWPSIELRKKPHNTPDGGTWPRAETLQGVDLFEQYKTQAERAHGDALLDYAVSPDRHWLATAGSDATVRLWPLSSEALTGHVCSRLTRNLTDKEWHEFQIGDGPRRPTCSGLP